MYVQETSMNHVGFWARVLEYLLDGIAISIVSCILSLPILSHMMADLQTLNQVANTTTLDPAIAQDMSTRLLGFDLVSLIVSILNYVILQGATGQTVGKMIMGHRLVREDGSKPSWGIVIGRFFALIISGIPLYVGFMMAGWTKRKQALHDIICGTYVVRKTKFAPQSKE